MGRRGIVRLIYQVFLKKCRQDEWKRFSFPFFFPFFKSSVRPGGREPLRECLNITFFNKSV